MSGALDFALLALLAGLFGLDRRAAFQLMLSQPIVAVPALGLAFGALEPALWLGCLLQLLWMSAVLHGASTPPNETVGAMVIAGAAVLLPRVTDLPIDDSVMALAVVFGAPWALVGKAADQHLDRANLALAARADAAAQAADLRALARVPVVGALRVFALHAVLITVGAALTLGLTALVRPALSLVGVTALTAFITYALPALGLAVALAAVRRRRGVALGGLIFLGVLLALGHGAPGLVG